MPIRRFGLLLLVASALLMGACTRALDFGPTGELTDPDQLIALLDARAATRQSLKSEAKARIVTPDQKGSVDALIAAARPGRLHVELLDFFGRPQASLVADGGRFALHEASSARFYRGPATADNLARLLVVPMTPEEAVQILLGTIPRIQASRKTLSVDRSRRAYRLDLEGGGARQSLWIDTETLRPLRSELRGTRGLDIDFRDFQLVGALVVPFEVHLVALGPAGEPLGIELNLRQRDVELDQALPETLFRLKQPAGTTAFELDGAPGW